MPVYPMKEWLPDLPDYRNPGVLTAEDVFPSARGYTPVPAYTSATDALAGRPLGAIQARDTSDNAFQYAGDATALYQNVDGTWTDRSNVGGYSAAPEGRWDFAVWKDKVLATNFVNNPQQITFGSSAFSNLTTAFKAKNIAVVRDFVVFGNTNDSSDGSVPSRVRWSAFNDETDYTVSASTLSDFQDLKTGAIVRMFGGEYGVIFQEQSVVRMTFVGAPVVFQFDEVVPGIGLIAPGAAVQVGDAVYFLSNKGFYVLEGGARARPIGAGRVDRFVLDNINDSEFDRISAAADPKSQRVFWSYAQSGQDDPNKIICYDAAFDRWSLIDEAAELLWRAGETDVTVDSLAGAVDDLDVSVDADRWFGGAPGIGIFDENYESGFFTGSNKTATIEVGEFELNEGGHARLNGFRALVDAGTVTAEVGTRNSQSASVSYGSSLSVNSNNRFTTRSNARYHRFRFTLSGAWTDAVGMQIDRNDLRAGGQRG